MRIRETRRQGSVIYCKPAEIYLSEVRSWFFIVEKISAEFIWTYPLRSLSLMILGLDSCKLEVRKQ